MEGFEEKLAEVRKYGHLYDSSRRDYKDTQKTNSSWNEIARNLNTNEQICRQKWKNLRDRYTKAKKRMKSRSGDAGGKSIPPIFLSLSWLSDHIKHTDTETNFREENTEEPITTSESLPLGENFVTINMEEFDLTA
ncbi:uncharacterized protein LOC124456099 [Xenia sp. Carnegie-2017]|uniref:uncharacterized protein LOC124456099 n=1 Tax=Xenia sp. Carnegie-2017 TaxID=2897299 RepID=UPI001F0365B5|nr:uncharacterized protein LOC124456099 [Xenia sp. Carnegie-2017]